MMTIRRGLSLAVVMAALICSQMALTGCRRPESKTDCDGCAKPCQQNGDNNQCAGVNNGTMNQVNR